MSVRQSFVNIVSQAQHEEFCHKKLIKLMLNSYSPSRLEEFLSIFSDSLHGFYIAQFADKNPYVARALKFLASLAIKITVNCVKPLEVTNPDGTISEVYDITEEPFFNNCIKLSLKYSQVPKAEVRFNTCYFVTELLQNISNNVEVNNSVCNSILDSILNLLHDPKVNIRLQAIKAVLRLQEPVNPDCQVMNSFLLLATDPNSEVRKTVTKLIALNPQSCIKIKDRINDCDLGVRHAAYIRLSDINPRFFLRVIDRNLILKCAFADREKKINQVLTEKLLPKWLTAFEGNYLNLINGLKLDADESDLKNFKELCTKVLDVYLMHNPLTDILKYLPINEGDKVIPVKKLLLDSVLYWSNIINFLRKRDDAEEYLDGILPDLTTFSNYIEKVLKEKSAIPMEEWEKLELQNIIFELFEITSGFDMSDEVGKKTLNTLILHILPTYKFQQKVLDRILSIAVQLDSNIDTFTTNMCQVISEIREPLADEVPSEEKLRAKNFEISQLKVKMHQLEIAEEEAARKKDFQYANIAHNEILDCQRKLDILMQSEKIRVAKDDPETLCRCLDILIGLMKVPGVSRLSPALLTCRDEFLMPLLTNTSSEVHWRFIQSLGLLALVSKEMAFQHANFMCLPIATYKAVQNYDKMAVKVSVMCITDIIRLYGVSVIGIGKDSEFNNEQSQSNTRRKLYSQDTGDVSVVSKDDISVEFIIDIILDMLDDEEEDIRCTAISSISKLMVQNFPVSPELMQRLILKWYNPLTEKKDTKLQQKIGHVIQYFSQNIKGAKKIIENAVIPIITTIANAPRTSPLQEIDIDNVVRFLAGLTGKSDNETENFHNSLATSVVEKMSNKPNDDCIPHLAKLLTYLDIDCSEVENTTKLIRSVELLLTDLVDKFPRKNLLKFMAKLKSNLSSRHGVNITENFNASEASSIGGMTQKSRENLTDSSQEVSVSKRTLYTDNSKENCDKDVSSDNDDTQEASSKSESMNDLDEHKTSTQISLRKGGKKSFEHIERKKIHARRDRSKIKKTLQSISEESLDEEADVKKKLRNIGSSEKVNQKSSSTSEINDEMESNVDQSNVFLKYDYTTMKATQNKSRRDDTETVQTPKHRDISPVVSNEKEKSLAKDGSSKKSSKEKNVSVFKLRSHEIKIISNDKVQSAKKNSSKKSENSKSLKITESNANSNTVSSESHQTEQIEKSSKEIQRGMSLSKGISFASDKKSSISSALRFSSRISTPPRKLQDYSSPLFDKKTIKSGPSKERQNTFSTPTKSPRVLLAGRTPRLLRSTENVLALSLRKRKLQSSLERSGLHKRKRVSESTSRSQPNKIPDIDPLLSETSIPSTRKINASNQDDQTPAKNYNSRITRLSMLGKNNAKPWTFIPTKKARKLREFKAKKAIRDKRKERKECATSLDNEQQKDIDDRVKKPINENIRRSSRRKVNGNFKKVENQNFEVSSEDEETTQIGDGDSIDANVTLEKGMRKSIRHLKKNEESEYSSEDEINTLGENSENSIHGSITSEESCRKSNRRKLNGNMEHIKKKNFKNSLQDDDVKQTEDSDCSTQTSDTNIRRSERHKVNRNKTNVKERVNSNDRHVHLKEKVTTNVQIEKGVHNNNTRRTRNRLTHASLKRSKGQDKKLRQNVKTNVNVLKNLNNVLNTVQSDERQTRKSARHSSRSKLDSSVVEKTSGTSCDTKLSINTPVQENIHCRLLAPLNTRASRSSMKVNGAFSRSRRCSRSSSNETALRTFLQGDEVFQDLDDISIEDVTSESNTTNDSKKENLSIVSATSSSTKSDNRTRKRLKGKSPNHKSKSPKKKRSKPNSNRVLRSVAH